MRSLNVLLSLLVLLVLLALCLEGGLRLIGKGPVQTLNQFDPVTGWSKEAGRKVTRHGKGFEATFEINSLGLRDDPLPLEKPAGEFRVLALGDSFTLGYTVQRDDLFVDLLERSYEHGHVQVINTGTEGWSTDQEVAWLQAHGKQFAPDVVLLFPYENDLFWNGQSSYTRFPKPRFTPTGQREEGSLSDPGPRPVLERYALTKLFGGLFGQAPTIPTFTPAGGKHPVSAEFAPLFEPPPAVLGDAVQRTRGCLLALRETCQQLGAKLLIVPIPSKSDIDPAFAQRFATDYLGVPRWSIVPSAPVDRFLSLARELGIESYDARPLLEAADTPESAVHLDLFSQAEFHFTPAGNRAFAQALRAELDRHAWLPAEAQGGQPLLSSSNASAPLPRWPFVYLGLLIALSALYMGTYPKENKALAPLKVGGMLAAIFAIFLGVHWLTTLLPSSLQRWLIPVLVLSLLGFVLYKLGRRLSTVLELLKAFVLRGHWYLMPVVVVLLSIGGLLVVAASSPLVAPFIYTLF